MNLSYTDKKFMGMALSLAEKGRGYTSPNPPVGAIIVKEGKVVGKGYHKKAGTAHAEVNAIADAGDLARGADIYVTLEPCNHTGKTPPCTMAILNAGIKRVVIGAKDPNPKVEGGGAEFLRQKGLKVETGCLEDKCRLLIAPFAKHIRTGLPWIRTKAAASLDGRVATRTGHSKWITNDKARAYGQMIRRWSDAILVGRNTALQDDPSLTFRDEGWPPKTLLRVILDSSLSLPSNLKLFNVAPFSPTLVATTEKAPVQKKEELEEKGVEVVVLPSDEAGSVDLKALIKFLGEQNVQSVLVEGGAKIHGSFWDNALVDEAFFFFAPIIIGGASAPSSIPGKGIDTLTEAPRLQNIKIERLKDNFLVHGLVTRVEDFWS